jgi:hypothetical protein
MKTKECFKCGEEKPLSEFYKHSKMADGRVNKCKECNKRDVRDNYASNREHYREYERGRANLSHRVKAREDYAKTPQGEEAYRKAKNKWVRNNPIKKAASTMVGNAVRGGKLAKPDICECCGSEPKRLHGHHDDYAFPLVVRWLCPGCHSQWHKKNGEGKNAR